MKLKIIFIISIVFLGLLGTAAAGVGTYFTVLYFTRDDNHSFEAAYLYDTSFEKEVDVDLGTLYIEQPKEQEIMVKSVLGHSVTVNFQFFGEKTELGNYLKVKFLEEDTTYSLNYLIDNIKIFTIRLDPEEEKVVKFTYVVANEINVPKGAELSFTLFIKAYDLWTENKLN